MHFFKIKQIFNPTILQKINNNILIKVPTKINSMFVHMLCSHLY